MDRDMVNIIHYLYHHGVISDEATKQLLHCYHDTVEPLKNSRILSIKANEWKLSPGVADFIRLAEANLQSFPPRDWIFNVPLNAPLPSAGAPRHCFVLMPYGPQWSRAVADGISRAARGVRYTYSIAKDVASTGGVMQQVWESIRKADAVVADLTGNNPNVLYETGIAHALGKDVVLITQNINELPFDLRALRCIEYQQSNLPALESELQLFLQNVPPRY
jgi:hypothetical protein